VQGREITNDKKAKIPFRGRRKEQWRERGHLSQKEDGTTWKESEVSGKSGGYRKRGEREMTDYENSHRGEKGLKNY